MAATNWRKSSFSNPNGECVEVGTSGAEIVVRDSKHPDRKVLAFTRGEWEAFLKGVRASEFDVTVRRK